MKETLNIQRYIKAAIAALLLGSASSAIATVITVGATGLPASNYLAGDTYTGSFNLNGLSSLPTQFTVNSLRFTFAFTDDTTDPFTSTTGASSTSSSTVVTEGKDRSATTTTTTLVPVTRTGERESAKLSFGGIDFSGQTAAGNAVTGSNTVAAPRANGGTIKVKNNVVCTAAEIAHDNSCKDVTLYTVQQTTTETTTTDYSGAFTLQGTLLASMLQDKVLNFGLGITGDLVLSGASLTVDYTETLVPNEVPEPASVMLFGIALAGFIGVRAKRRAGPRQGRPQGCAPARQPLPSDSISATATVKTKRRI